MSGLKRVIAHWSVTGYDFNGVSDEHYHFTVNGKGAVRAGKFRPEANIRPSKGLYAAHTLGCNTGSIGIACLAMVGAKTVDSVGPCPILEPQFEAMCKKIAELCIKYGIPVTPQTVLSHAEVQTTLGIKQRGKWDIAVLPYAGLKTATAVGDYMRRRVRSYAFSASAPKPAPAPASAPKPAPAPASAPKPAPAPAPAPASAPKPAPAPAPAPASAPKPAPAPAPAPTPTPVTPKSRSGISLIISLIVAFATAIWMMLTKG